MSALIRGALRGAAAGASGTTALNTLAYLDMLARARPASTTPEDTVEELSRRTGIEVPGEGQKRDNRVAALGPLTGIAAGLGAGLVLGAARALGLRPGLAVSALVATVGALIGTNGPMTALGVTNPRTWAGRDWVADVVPHLAYGIVTAGVLQGLDGDRLR